MRTIFHKAQDYQAFLSILALAKARHPVKMFAFSLMPNHFHFLIEASHHQSRTALLQHYGSSGHVWQGRFKSFPVQRDEHLLMVLRHVLQNPVRSGLAASIDDWPWSSCCRNELADPCPVGSRDRLAGACGRTVISEPIGFNSSVSESSKTFWRTRLADDDRRSIWTESTMRPRGRPALSEMRK